MISPIPSTSIAVWDCVFLDYDGLVEWRLPVQQWDDGRYGWKTALFILWKKEWEMHWSGIEFSSRPEADSSWDRALKDTANWPLGAVG